MFLPLADRMTKKYVEEGKINAEAGEYRGKIIDQVLNVCGNFYKLTNQKCQVSYCYYFLSVCPSVFCPN